MDQICSKGYFQSKIEKPNNTNEFCMFELCYSHSQNIWDWLYFSWEIGHYWKSLHCIKGVRIRSYSGPHFSHIFPHSDWIRGDVRYLSVFGPNAEKCGKSADQNNSESDTFYAVLTSVFEEFVLVWGKFWFWQEEWVLGYHSMKFRHFPDIF